MYYNWTCNNFEDYIQYLKGWDVDVRKLDKGGFLGTLSLIDCQTVQTIKFHFDGIIDRYGSSPEGYVSFVIPGNSFQTYHWLNKEIDSSIIAKFSDSRELDMLSKNDFSSIGLNIESTYFNSLIEQYQFQNLQKVIQKEDQIFQLSVYEVMHLANYIHNLHFSLEKNPLLIDNSEFIYKVQYVLPYLLMELLDKSNIPKLRTNLNKSDIVFQETISYINCNISKKISIANLTKYGGVSERTLTQTFKQKLGVTPLRYINRTKLNLIRRELSKQTNSETIRSIILKYGMTHLGQFSKDYYNLFNELPSDTRKKQSG